MELPTTTLTHNGDEYTISYEQWFTCGNCSNEWEATHIDGDPSACEECGETSDHMLEYRVHYYLKYDAIPLSKDELEPDADLHIDAMQHTVNEFKALNENGWELTESDGVHLYFTKTITTSTT